MRDLSGGQGSCLLDGGWVNITNIAIGANKMLMRSQPLNSRISAKFEAGGKDNHESMTEQNIISQYIGDMFEDLRYSGKKRKIKLTTRLEWKARDIKGLYHDIKHTLRNHIKWHRYLKKIRPWEGFSGLICVMQAHLRDYVACEEKFGSAEETFKRHKIDTAKEVIKLLKRMKEPDEYTHRRRKEVERKYPKYKHLVTKYKNGGRGYSGDFVAQGNGWVGEESGKNPRKGYFEFVDKKFVLVESPNQRETDRLLAQLKAYHEEIRAAYTQAEADSDHDFEKLCGLLKENLYSWWD